MSINIQEDNKQISLALDFQDKKISSFTTSYNELIDKISVRDKVRTNIETAKKELEAKINTKIHEFKLK